MKIRDIKKILVENNIEPNEAEREAYMFVEHFLNLNSVYTEGIASKRSII